MSSPLLSVIIPVYNAEPYIKDAVASILNQTYRNLELIIINDGSTDKTLEVIASIQDNRIILVKNRINRGQIYTRNLGLKMAKGAYIGMFDADDIAYPDKYEAQIASLEKNKDIGMVGSWARFIDADGTRTGGGWKLRARPEMIPSIMLFKNYFLQSAVVYRKECIHNFSFKEGYDIGEDYVIWLEILEKYKAWNLQKYLVDYRIHPESVTNSRPELQLEKEKEIFKQQLAKLGIEATEDELNLHLLIKGKNPAIDRKIVKEIERWLLKIREQNDKSMRYDKKMLSRTIFNRWLKACKNYGLHMHMFYFLGTSKLLRQYIKSYF